MRPARSIHCMFSIFFFQAEDGIRDPLVTGVQTCALPIWQTIHDGITAGAHLEPKDQSDPTLSASPNGLNQPKTAAVKITSDRGPPPKGITPEIGRASCREREKISEGWGKCKKK